MTLYMCMYSSECSLTWIGVKVTNTLSCWCQPPYRAAYSVGKFVTWPLNMAMETAG